MAVNQKLKSLLLKAQTGSRTPKYKRVFVSGNGTEYRFRPLSTEKIDPQAIPFKKVSMHGGYKHPNYEGDYTSNFRCIGKDCPMCKDSRALKKTEYDNNIPRKMKTAWKKERNRYSLIWGINRENDELTLFLIPDTDRFKKVKDKDTGKEEWKKVNTTCHEILFQKLMNAAENNQDPLSYTDGNDIIIKSKKVDGVVKWDISIDSEKNSVSEEVLKKFSEFPKLDDLYQKYSQEELEYIVKGKPFNKNISKQKAKEEKEEFNQEVNDISNEDISEDDNLSEDEAALLGEEEFSVDSDDDETFSSLSDELKDILNKGSDD